MNTQKDKKRKSRNEDKKIIEYKNIVNNRQDYSLTTKTSSSSASSSLSLYEKYFSQDAYINRLRTFKSSSTYFAKPIQLSPLIVARFGWCNTQQDVLTCISCKAHIYISYHAKLSSKSYNNITKQYITKIASCHDTVCIFKKETESLLLSLSSSSSTNRKEVEEEDTNDESIFPSYLYNVLNDDYLLWKKSKEFILYHMHKKCIILQKNTISFPITISTILRDNNDDFLSLAKLSIIHDKINDVDKSMSLEEEGEEKENVVIAKEVVLLSLLGWNYNNDNEQLECPLCLAPLSVSSDGTIKRKNVLSCHKYYCPFVYCAKTTKSGWTKIVDKMLL